MLPAFCFVIEDAVLTPLSGDVIFDMLGSSVSLDLVLLLGVLVDGDDVVVVGDDVLSL